MPYAGPQIFVFTAGNADAQAHLADSIEAPVVLERVLAQFPRESEAEIRRIHDVAEGLYAWGAVPGQQNTPRWQQMKPGDWALCVFESRYRFAAKVIAKYDNTNFAREVWGTDAQGRTWNLVYFLTKPQAISIPVSSLAENLNASYMGFFRIGDERLERIARDFGSVDAFVENRVLNVSGGEIPDGITREDVINAISDIDAGENGGFGESTTYDLLFEERRYPPKMVLGLSARRVLGRTLRHTEFSGGEQSKCFRVLRSLGFDIVPKPSAEYFLIRSNDETQYQDELGKRYHYTNTVPNYRKLRDGGYAVVDRKTPQGARLLGFGLLDPAAPNESQGSTEYDSIFRTWTAFSQPREIPADAIADIRALPGYNVQHAVRPITKEIFDRLTSTGEAKTMDLKTAADSFAGALQKSHVHFGAAHQAVVRAFLASLATKRFAILTGLSGSGKTQIALRFGDWLGKDRLHVAPVRPDWTGAEALFGYEDALKPLVQDLAAWSVPEPLAFMLRAAADPANAYALVLDEMNLAHVERYFADVLSGMESGEKCLPNLARGSDGCWRLRSDSETRIPFPSNLFVIGTVNVDETTYMFSPKVLDRANTFEFRVASSDLVSTSKKPIPCTPADPALIKSLVTMAADQEWHISKPYSHIAELENNLKLLHRMLALYNFEFGHRVFFEATRFAAFLEQAGDGGLRTVLDRIVMQKILPRLHGSRRRLEMPLLGLAHYARMLPSEIVGESELAESKPEDADITEVMLPSSFDKATRMLRAVRTNQFASFTE
jgi:5-methylcytosine-specific restriction enzyme B